MQRPVVHGRTLVEIFVSAHPELAESDRRMLLGWRDVVEGVFEIRERDGAAVIAVNLIDALTYRIRSNAGPAALTPMRPGCFMIGRIVPVGGEWMLSGALGLYDASERAAMLQVAAELATKHPRLVFRNPENVAKGWELQRKHRNRFIEFFGSDLVVVPGSQVVSRMADFFEWYTRQALAEVHGAGASRDEEVAASTPNLDIPDDLASAPTVALICDETEGLVFLANFRLIQEAFENPELAADREHREAVLGYLSADSISTLPFRRLAERDTTKASRLFQRLLKKPDFSWERNGEALLRKHKPRCFSGTPQPRTTPLRQELAEALPASRPIGKTATGTGRLPSRGR